MIGFLLGVLCSALSVFIYVFRDDLRRLPSIWRTEPDRNLRHWFVAIRRRVTGYVVLEPNQHVPEVHRMSVAGWKACRAAQENKP